MIDKAWSDFHNAILAEGIKKAGFRAEIKLGSKEMRFFREMDTKDWAGRHSEVFDIGILYPKGKMLPDIPDWAYWRLLHIAMASQGFPPQVEKYKIILSCDTTKTKEPGGFDEKVFEQWLKRFKGKSIAPMVLDYLKRRLVNGQKETFQGQMDDLKQLGEYETYLTEFFGKLSSFQQLSRRVIESGFKKDTELYQKYLSYQKNRP